MTLKSPKNHPNVDIFQSCTAKMPTKIVPKKCSVASVPTRSHSASQCQRAPPRRPRRACRARARRAMGAGGVRMLLACGKKSDIPEKSVRYSMAKKTMATYVSDEISL